MKNLLLAHLIFLALLLPSQLLAQRPQGTQGGERPKIGKLTGKVVDAQSGEPVEFATVSLFNRRDSSLVTGGITNMKGEFAVDQIPVGVYRVSISFIGYRPARRDSLAFTFQQPEINVGKIMLNPSAQQLAEVEVVAEKEVFEQSIDKRVFNVEKNIVSLGGSANDILETIPSVSVDIDGNISLRGSTGVIVLIDGRPSGLTGADRAAILAQIPASAIERIEVVTNPSAKYDAEGMAGIINVILKKNKLEGFNGMTTFSAGTRHKYNGSLDLNYRTGSWNTFMSYSYRYDERFNRGFANRQNTLGEQTLFLDQSQFGMSYDATHLIRAGFDYNINNENTIGFSVVHNQNNEVENRDLGFSNFNGRRELTGLFNRYNRDVENRGTTDMTFSYRKTYQQPGRELTASANYSMNQSDDVSGFFQTDFGPDGMPLPIDPIWQRNPTKRDNRVLIMQADYVQPMANGKKMETGYKSIVRNVDSDFIFQNFNYDTDLFEINPLLTNRFLFSEQIHSLYGTYSGKAGKLGYQLGGRLEQTLMRTEQLTTEQTFDNNYLNFFPSVFLAWDFTENKTLQLNYTRRINRPGLYSLNPFVDFSDPLNIRFGNPELQPEFTNAFETSYIHSWKGGHTLTSSVFYRHTNGVIQRVISVDEENVSSVTFANLATRRATGFEFILRNNLLKWWNVTTNVNVYHNAIDGGNLGQNFTNDNLFWSVMIMSNMTIPKIASVQMNWMYRGPMAMAQGIMQPIYGLNIGARREILNKKGSIAVNISDIFDTRQFGMETSGPGFSQEFMRKRETRIGTLTFTYKFGKYIEKNNRRGRRGGESGGGGDSDVDFF